MTYLRGNKGKPLTYLQCLLDVRDILENGKENRSEDGLAPWFWYHELVDQLDCLEMEYTGKDKTIAQEITEGKYQ